MSQSNVHRIYPDLHFPFFFPLHTGDQRNPNRGKWTFRNAEDEMEGPFENKIDCISKAAEARAMFVDTMPQKEPFIFGTGWFWWANMPMRGITLNGPFEDLTKCKESIANYTRKTA